MKALKLFSTFHPIEELTSTTEAIRVRVLWGMLVTGRTTQPPRALTQRLESPNPNLPILLLQEVVGKGKRLMSWEPGNNSPPTPSAKKDDS